MIEKDFVSGLFNSNTTNPNIHSPYIWNNASWYIPPPYPEEPKTPEITFCENSKEDTINDFNDFYAAANVLTELYYKEDPLGMEFSKSISEKESGSVSSGSANNNRTFTVGEFKEKKRKYEATINSIHNGEMNQNNSSLMYEAFYEDMRKGNTSVSNCSEDFIEGFWNHIIFSRSWPEENGDFFKKMVFHIGGKNYQGGVWSWDCEKGKKFLHLFWLHKSQAQEYIINNIGKMQSHYPVIEYDLLEHQRMQDYASGCGEDSASAAEDKKAAAASVSFAHGKWRHCWIEENEHSMYLKSTLMIHDSKANLSAIYYKVFLPKRFVDGKFGDNGDWERNDSAPPSTFPLFCDPSTLCSKNYAAATDNYGEDCINWPSEEKVNAHLWVSRIRFRPEYNSLYYTSSEVLSIIQAVRDVWFDFSEMWANNIITVKSAKMAAAADLNNGGCGGGKQQCHSSAAAATSISEREPFFTIPILSPIFYLQTRLMRENNPEICVTPENLGWHQQRDHRSSQKISGSGGAAGSCAGNVFVDDLYSFVYQSLANNLIGMPFFEKNGGCSTNPVDASKITFICQHCAVHFGIVKRAVGDPPSEVGVVPKCAECLMTFCLIPGCYQTRKDQSTRFCSMHLMYYRCHCYTKRDSFLKNSGNISPGREEIFLKNRQDLFYNDSLPHFVLCGSPVYDLNTMLCGHCYSVYLMDKTIDCLGLYMAQLSNLSSQARGSLVIKILRKAMQNIADVNTKVAKEAMEELSVLSSGNKKRRRRTPYALPHPPQQPRAKPHRKNNSEQQQQIRIEDSCREVLGHEAGCSCEYCAKYDSFCHSLLDQFTSVYFSESGL